MQNATLQPKPTTEDLDTGVADRSAVASGLAHVLADTYVLIVKTHAYHWNVVGPHFYSIHKLTEEHYENMFEAADELAERIRALGEIAPMNFKAMGRLAAIDEAMVPGAAAEMVEDLAGDHERLSRRLHELIRLAEKSRDQVTADLATQRSAFHEKSVWMLRAILAE